MTAVTDEELAAVIARADKLIREGAIKVSQAHPIPKRRPGTGRNRGKAQRSTGYADVNHKGKKCLFWPFSKAYGHPGLVGYCGKVFKPGRLVCMLAHGAPPSDQHKASHICGRGSTGCIHPQHLAWRTESEVRQNMERVSGHNSGRWGKITPRQCEEIERIGASEPKAVIAKRYGISAQRVGQILNGHGFRPRRGWIERGCRFYARVATGGTVYSLGAYATGNEATSAYHDAVAHFDAMGLFLLIQGGSVIGLTDQGATIRRLTGATLTRRKLSCFQERRDETAGRTEFLRVDAV